MLPEVILILAIVIGFVVFKIIPYFYNKSLLFEVPFDIPATIGTHIKEGYESYSNDYYKKKDLKRHYRDEYPELIFEKGYQFENKIDNKIYDFPFYKKDHYHLDVINFYKYGYGAKIICRFMITRNKKTGEIIDWKLSAIKPITYGNRKYELIREYEDPGIVLHREWRKNGYPKGHVIPQYEINEYDKILSKEDGLSFYSDEISEEEKDRFDYYVLSYKIDNFLDKFKL